MTGFPSFLKPSNIPLYIHHILLIHSSVDVYLGCFHIFATVNNAAVNIGTFTYTQELSLVLLLVTGKQSFSNFLPQLIPHRMGYPEVFFKSRDILNMETKGWNPSRWLVPSAKE